MSNEEPGRDIEIEVGEQAVAKDHASVGDAELIPEPPRTPYRVIAESGIFKNGKQYDKGDTVELIEQAAADFLAAGDVEEV